MPPSSSTAASILSCTRKQTPRGINHHHRNDNPIA
uniref:Uncharacterized protein n=1 Tax=Arundo donax TaxID=35708 RepID=A0A0A9ED89_ARUDO